MKRMLAVLIIVFMILTNIGAFASDLDLSTMTKDELLALRDMIDEEIKTNHTTTSEEDDKILTLTKQYVEEYLKNQGASRISWPWFDYTYSKDWTILSVKTSVSYRTENGKNEPNVYSEVYSENDIYTLYYVKLGDKEILNIRTEILGSESAGEKKDTGAENTTKGSFSFQTETKTKPTNTPKTNNTKAPKITPTPEPKLFFGFNEPVEYDGITYTMLGYRESKGSTFNEPDSGNVFLLIEFLVQNNGKSSDYISYYDFNAYCDDYQTDISFAATLEAKTSLGGELAPGKKMRGEVGIEVPKNWKEFELHLSTGWFSDDIVFRGTRKR